MTKLTLESTFPNEQNLPANYLIELSELSAITIAGDEQSSYLQGQVTCDVTQLDEKKLLVGSHCDAKGKMFAIFRLFKRHNALWLLQPKATLSNSLATLQKFGVFAKVEIAEAPTMHCYALSGQNAPTLLKEHFEVIPDSMSPVVQVNKTTLIYLGVTQINQQEHTKYLLIDDNSTLVDTLANFKLPTFSHQLWNLHEILSGFPIMSQQAVGEFVPQMLNVQAINGISFTKGCYLGQETVARMQYLGKNKRALFTLKADNLASNLLTSKNNNITIDAAIMRQLGENWRRAGNVLSYYQADNGDTYLQAVLASDIDKNTHLALQHNDVTIPLTLIPLPYALTQEPQQ